MTVAPVAGSAQSPQPIEPTSARGYSTTGPRQQPTPSRESCVINEIGGASGGGLWSNRLLAAGSGFAPAWRDGVGTAAPRGVDAVPQPDRITGTQRPRTAGEPAPANRVRRTEQPVSATAYQGTRDGDDAVFGSRRDELTDRERKQVEQLEARDREVRIHEQAHVAAAGELFRGGPYYEFRTGPDGKRYAVGGRVSIDTSPGETPEQTIAKAAKIRAAALAPAEPSSADRAVAAKARRMETEARQEQVEAQRADADRRADGMTARVTGEADVAPVRPFDPTANAPERDTASLIPAELRGGGLSPVEAAVGGGIGQLERSAASGSLLGTLYA